MSSPWAVKLDSVGLRVPIHVVLLAGMVVSLVLFNLSAVEAVQEAAWYLRHHWPIRDGLGHSINCSLNTGINLWLKKNRKRALFYLTELSKEKIIMVCSVKSKSFQPLFPLKNVSCHISVKSYSSEPSILKPFYTWKFNGTASPLSFTEHWHWIIIPNKCLNKCVKRCSIGASTTSAYVTKL